MHEFSTMARIVDTVLSEIKRYEVKKVKEVYIQVGELTFLSEEQMRFAYKVLSEQNLFLKGSKLRIDHRDVSVECESCGYSGSIDYEDDPMYHYLFPKLCCPRCGGRVRITSGRECILKNIKIVC